MSESRHANEAERAALLADRLLRSAKKDGLDDMKLAALGQRLFEARTVATPKLPIVAMVLGSLVTLGGAFAYSRANVDAGTPIGVPEPIASAYVVSEPPAATPPTPPDADAPLATLSVALLPDAPPTANTARVRPEAVPSTSAPTAAEDLSGEIRALERVHQAVAQNRITDANVALAEYERSFPKKLLGQEARVLEIQVLLAEGRREDAEARARAFLAGSGADSPYAARVHSLVALPRTP